jgi:hypothetical protein
MLRAAIIYALAWVAVMAWIFWHAKREEKRLTAEILGFARRVIDDAIEKGALALLLVLTQLVAGCAIDLATRRGPADERVVLLHVSLLRRGCYAMTGGDLSLEAEDRAASRELAAAATVGGSIAAGPVGAGVAAVGAALSEAVGDPPPEVPCR